MLTKQTHIKDVLWFFVFWGVIAAIFRMWFGLGVTTNLSDEVPWGLWKILNMIAGVALSTSGFTIGFLAYVLKIEKFKPLVRPAILVAFLGYGSSCMALMFDIGLPLKFWHPFIYWNYHSFLFEVFWCVILYFTITLIELTPNILERYNLKKLVKFLHTIAPGVVIVGISLSSLHHSSLGSLFLTTPSRLHELWFTTWIPLMFILSAMGGGMMFLILAKMFYARFYNPIPVFGKEFRKDRNLVCSLDGSPVSKINMTYGKDMPVLSKLATIATSILALYLILKIYDLFEGGAINALLAGTWESWLFAVELILTAVVPIVMISFRRVRRSPLGLGFLASSASFGVVLNRVDVGIFGYFRDAGTVYFPSLAEWCVSIGVVAAAILAFMYISENFTIFDNKWKNKRIEKGIFKSAFDSFSRVWITVLQNGIYRISLIGVFVIPLAFVLMYPFGNTNDQNIHPATGVDISRNILMIDGNAMKASTKFPHKDHQMRLGNEKSCTICHHINMPGDLSTPCARCHQNMVHETKIFNHSFHMEKVASTRQLSGLHPGNKSCTVCHAENQAKTKNNALKCNKCHSEDMNLKNTQNKNTNFTYANSYMNAMHKNCIPCHEKNDKSIAFQNSNRKLSDCSTCHSKTQQLSKLILTYKSSK